MGVRGSYWLTGGIMTVAGLILARLLAGVLGTIAATAGAFVLAAAALLLKAAIILVMVSLAVFLIRRRRRTVRGTW